MWLETLLGGVNTFAFMPRAFDGILLLQLSPIPQGNPLAQDVARAPPPRPSPSPSYGGITAPKTPCVTEGLEFLRADGIRYTVSFSRAYLMKPHPHNIVSLPSPHRP